MDKKLGLDSESDKFRNIFRNTNKFRLGLIALLAGLMALSFIEYKIDIPENLLRRMEKNGIYTETREARISLLPFPSVKISTLTITIPGNSTMKFDEVILSIDVFSLWFNTDHKILNGRVSKMSLMVLPDIVPDSRSPVNVESVLEQVKNITELISLHLDLPETLAVDEFDLRTYRNPGKTLVFAKDVRLTTQAYGRKITLTAGVDAWLNSQIELNIYLTQSAEMVSSLKRINIFIEHELDLSKIQDKEKTSASFPVGNFSVRQYLSYSLPLKIVKFQTGVQIHRLNVPGRLQVLPEDNARIHLYGSADKDRVTADLNWENLGYQGAKGNVEWKYINKFITVKTSGSTDFRLVSRLLSRNKNILVQNFLSEVSGIFFLHEVQIFPWTGSFKLRSTVDLAGRIPKARFPTYKLNGIVNVNANAISSKNLSFRTKNSSLNLNNMQFTAYNYSNQFSAELRLTAGLEDLITGSNGNLQVYLDFDCELRSEINCGNHPFLLYGTNLKVPAGAAARFLRFLTFNFTVYENSLKSRSEVEIDSLDISGFLNKDILSVNRSYIMSDLGIFKISGNFSPFVGNGSFALYHSPFSTESIFRRIPLLGQPLKFSMDLATELIFRIDIKNYSAKLSNWSMGKGVDAIRGLFRN
ncbi:MAG: hypothetical protein KDK41_02270 [Leptospiraceae bacterium]|nr:hypothetical protein [Leptospiraceae bacterium]